MKQQMLERRVTELEDSLALLKQQLSRAQEQLKDERSGKTWREANAGRSMERERINS